MTTKNTNIMGISCEVKLQRYNGPLLSSKINDLSMLSKNTDVSNLTPDLKRSSRVTRKRALQDKSVVDNDIELGNMKKKKCSKIESEKPILSQKFTKKTDSKTFASVKSTTNSSTNNNYRKISDTEHSLDINVDNETKILIPTFTNKKSKSINSNKRKSVVTDTSKGNTSNESERSSNNTSLKLTKNKNSSKSISNIINNDGVVVLLERDKNVLKHLKFNSNINLHEETNVNKDETSNELESSNNTTPLKNSKNKKNSKSVSNINNTPLVINVNKDDISDKTDSNDNNYIISSNSFKQKTSKLIKEKAALKNLKNDKSDESEKNSYMSPKKPKNKISQSTNNIMNKVHTVDISYKNNDIVNSQKHSHSLSKKIHFQKSDNNVYSSEDDLQQSQNLTDEFEELYNNQDLELTEKFNTNTMTLRSDKPPKIKQKWSDEWCGDELTNNIKSYDLSNVPKVIVNNNKKLVKKQIKSRKPKRSKKIKIKMFQNLDKNTNKLMDTPVVQNKNINDLPLNINSNTFDTTNQSINNLVSQDINTNNLQLMNSSNINDTKDHSTKCVPVTQSPENKSIKNNMSLKKNVVTRNEVITDPINADNNTNMSYTATTSSSEFTIVPMSYTELSESVVSNQSSQFNTLESNSISMHTSDSSEISYGISILSEAISRQCSESNNKGIKKKSQVENEIKSSPKKTNSNPQSKTISAEISSQKVNKSTPRKMKYAAKLYEQSIEATLQANLEHGLHILSKRFNIPLGSLKKTVVDDPLAVFQKKYSESITPSMVTISPIVKDVETKFNYTKYVSGNLDVEYKIEPIRESAAYEKTNLKDLMAELSKTMPSWSLSIVTNPSRYIISHMSINMYGVPSANKCIVLDRYFRASVYINQCLEYTYCKRYTTATEIINLIKTLNSL